MPDEISPHGGDTAWAFDEARAELPADLVADWRRRLAGRRTFAAEGFHTLLSIVEQAAEVVQVRDAAGQRDRWSRAFPGLTLRHDLDHDIENAVRMAEWEARHGLRSTYFPLHTDWYYRAPGRNSGLSALLRSALDRIASLGHDIGLHNNAITVALLTGEDPAAVLFRELEELRNAGFDIRGTVAHGDPLCHQAGYVNSEVFSEFPRPKLGAPDRVVTPPDGVHGSPTRLSPVPMAELGLEFEAGFIGHRLYLSDTGGRWSLEPHGLRRRFEEEGGLLQILRHPVWWALQGEPVRPREPRTTEMPRPRRAS